ncbi:hypothetical protein COV17_03515 [Candidatus Woesearchaeota archaeon CG10_big_fil_rev_8_21_14_0_10_36_11]|nr:MAG: hypothetical protein COV17_03515 [Candidatus Woesearchaeota archaeon CG10_big_fil_rev_8_21_14_0_10_36_11]
MTQLKVDLYDFIDDWANKEFCMQKSFNEIFTLDGFPLEFLYNRSFRRYIIPSQINTYKSLEQNKNIAPFNKAKLFLFSKLLAQYLRINELKKIKFVKNKSKNKDKSEIIELNGQNKKKVLFLTFPHHMSDDKKIFRIEGIIKKIKEDQKFTEFVLFVDPLSRNEYKLVLGRDFLYSYYNEDIATKARNVSQALSSQWKRISNKTKLDFLTKDGISYWPFYKYAFNVYLSKEFLYIVALQYEMYKKVLAQESIAAVVLTGSSSIVERCLLAAAEKMNIPSIVIAHGIGKNSKNKDLMQSTTIAVFSEVEKEGYIQNGNKNDIRVVGPVVYDEISRYISEKESKCQKILIAIDSKVDGGSATEEDYFHRIEQIIIQINKISGINIDLKLHPKNTLYEKYVDIVEKNKFTNVRTFKSNISRDDFYQLIQECDVFVHFGSNAALEAMIIGRPIVTIDLLYKGIEHWIKNNDATIEIAYTDNIKNAIERAVREQDVLKQRMKKVVLEYCGIVDGKASERVIDLIHEVIGKNEKTQDKGVKS